MLRLGVFRHCTVHTLLSYSYTFHLRSPRLASDAENVLQDKPYSHRKAVSLLRVRWLRKVGCGSMLNSRAILDLEYPAILLFLDDVLRNMNS